MRSSLIIIIYSSLAMGKGKGHLLNTVKQNPWNFKNQEPRGDKRITFQLLFDLSTPGISMMSFGTKL